MLIWGQKYQIDYNAYGGILLPSNHSSNYKFIPLYVQREPVVFPLSLVWCELISLHFIIYCLATLFCNYILYFANFSGESMENALRACCKGIKIGKILIHREGDNGQQVCPSACILWHMSLSVSFQDHGLFIL